MLKLSRTKTPQIVLKTAETAPTSLFISFIVALSLHLGFFLLFAPPERPYRLEWTIPSVVVSLEKNQDCILNEVLISEEIVQLIPPYKDPHPSLPLIQDISFLSGFVSLTESNSDKEDCPLCSP